MPQRFLRPGITTSRNFDGCSWQAQSFYVRLITLVDDHGRYEADCMLLKSHAFPLREDIKAQQVQKLCEELSTNQLAVFYKVRGKAYLQLLKWQERARSDSKYPPLDNNCEQMFADVSGVTTNAAESCEILPPKPSPSPSPKAISHTSVPTALDRADFVVAWTSWLEHLRQKKKPATQSAQERQLRKLEKMGVERAIETINHSIERNWQGLFEPKDDAPQKPGQQQNQTGFFFEGKTYATKEAYDKARADWAGGQL